MEYIIIDTNIFYNNWFLESANFVFLSNYVRNTGAIILSSKIVNEEVQNKYEVELEGIKSSVQKNIKQLNSFYPSSAEFIFNNYRYDFETLLKSKFDNVIDLGYDKIDNSVVVSRAIKRIPPFKENEKGFRDTLIWLSLLSYLKEKRVKDDIIFITENYSDYFDKDSKQFKPSLSKDLEEQNLECTIRPFLNLQGFIDILDKDEYERSTMVERLQEIVNKCEADIETGIEFFINRLTSSQVQKFFSLKLKYPFIEKLFDFRFEIIEGLENIHIEHHKKIGDKQYYVTYELELRICSFLFGIPQTDYNKNKNEIDAKFTNLYFSEEDYAYFEKYIRPKLAINFIIHLEVEAISGVEVTSANFSVRE